MVTQWQQLFYEDRFVSLVPESSAHPIRVVMFQEIVQEKQR